MEEAITLPRFEFFDSTKGARSPRKNFMNSLMDFLPEVIQRVGIIGTDETVPILEELHLNTNSDLERYVISIFPEIIFLDQYFAVLEILDDIYERCSEVGWDGYESMPIRREVYKEANKVLSMLPVLSLPMPEILPEPDGGLGIEWYKDKGFSFTISVCGKSIITYAGLFGENSETHGTEPLSSSIPEVILDHLRRLFPSVK